MSCSSSAAAAKRRACCSPVDSEHSAIFQCLVGEDDGAVARRDRAHRLRRDRFWRLSDARGRWPRAAFDLSAGPSNLAHGNEEHHRLGDDDEQGAGDHRGNGSPLRRSGGTGPSSSSTPAVDRPAALRSSSRDGSVKAPTRAAPDMRVPIGYALAYPDRSPPCLPGAFQAELVEARPRSLPPFDKLRVTLRALGAKPDAGGVLESAISSRRTPSGSASASGLAYRALGNAGGDGAPAKVLSAASLTKSAVGCVCRRERSRFGEIAEVIEADHGYARARGATRRWPG